MNLVSLIGFLFLVLISGNTYSSTPTVLEIEGNHIFVPFGFDSNDKVEVVVSGYLPNSCYKVPKVEFVKKDNKFNFRIFATSYAVGNFSCRKVNVPFLKTVNLGVLKEGDYKIFLKKENKIDVAYPLKIELSEGDNSDQYIYANVDTIKREFGSRKVILSGTNPVDCFELDEILIFDNGVDTYSILPILKQKKDTCWPKNEPFKYEVMIPEHLELDEILLHVRAMNGSAVNFLFSEFIGSF